MRKLHVRTFTPESASYQDANAFITLSSRLAKKCLEGAQCKWENHEHTSACEWIKFRINPSLRAFSLVEIILYIALIVIMLGALVPLSLQMINIGVKSSTSQEVYSTAHYVSERVKYEIRNASDINIASSSFGINLAASSSATLSLAESSSTLNPTSIRVVSGTLQIIQGTSSPVSLNSNATKVTSLIFSNYSTSTYKNVGFELTITGSSTSNRTEYRASTTIRSSAEVRGK